MSNQMMKIGYFTAFGMANVGSALSFIKRLLFTEASTDCVRTKPRGFDALPHTKAYWVSLQRERIAGLKAKLEAGQLTSAFLKDTIADLKDLMGVKLGSPAVLFYELFILVQDIVDAEQAAIIQDAQGDIVASLYYAPAITYDNLLADIQLLIETTDLNTINSRLGQQWLGFYRTVFSPEDYDRALARISNYAEMQLSMQQTLSLEQIGLAQGQIEAFNQWRQHQVTMPRQTIDPRVQVSCYQPQVKIDGQCHPENAGRVKSTLFKRAFSTVTFPLRYLSSHPIMSGGIMLAMKAVAVYAQQAPTKLDMSDITATFSMETPNIVVRDIKHDLVSNDVSQAFQRRLQSEADTCTSKVHFPEPDAAWTVALGGSGNDFARKIAVHDNGNVAAVGQTASFGAGGDDLLLAQFNRMGTLDWAKTLGGMGEEDGWNLLTKPNGVVVVIGSTSSLGAGSDDVLIAQFDANGHMEWTRVFGGGSADVGTAIALKDNGSMLITGYTESFGSGDRDVLVAQVNSNGNLDWAKVLGGIDADSGEDILFTKDGGFLITGLTASYGSGGEDLFAAKFSAGNSLVWVKSFGGMGYDVGKSIGTMSDESLIITGRTSSVGAGAADVLILKVAMDGEFIWARAFGGSGGDFGYDIGVNSDDELLVISKAGSFGVIANAMLAQFNSAGDFQWARLIGGVHKTKGFDLAVKDDNSVVWVGETNGYAGVRDVLIMHSTPNGTFRYYDSGSLDQDILPIVTEIYPSNSSSIQYVAFNPVIVDIQPMITADVSALLVGNVDSSALRYQPIQPNTPAWPKPADAYLNYQWQYAVPEQKFLVLQSQPSVQINAENADWIRYDAATRTLSGTPIFVSQGEVRVRLIFESVLVPGMGLVTLEDVTLGFCVRIDHSTFIKRIGGAGNDGAREIAVKADGSTVITAYSDSYTVDGDDAFLLVQFSPTGQFDWARSFGGGGSYYPNDLSSTPDGSVVLSGNINDPIQACSTVPNIVVAKFYHDGQLHWAKTICTDFGVGIAGKPDNKVVLSGVNGMLSQFDRQGQLEWIIVISTSQGFSISEMAVHNDGSIFLVGNGLLIKLSDDGTLLWAKTYGGSSPVSITMSMDGNIIFAGTTASFGAGSNDIIVVRCDVDGNPHWASTLGSAGSETAISVAVGSGGAIMVMGGSQSLSLPLLSVYDADGAVRWANVLVSDVSFGFNEARAKPDGTYVLLGSTQKFGARGTDMLLVQVDHLGHLNFPGSNVIQPIAEADFTSGFVNLDVADATPLITLVNDTKQAYGYIAPALLWIDSSVVEGVWFMDYSAVPTIINHPFSEFLTLDMNTLLGRGVILTRVVEVGEAFLPGWLSYDADSRVLTGLPTGDVRGNYFIDIDLEGYGQSQTVTLAINVTNTVPYLTEWPVYNTTVGRFVVQLPFIDDEGDVVRPYAVDQVDEQLAPTIGRIDANTGRLFGTTLSGDQGVYVFNITARDPYSQGWQLVTVNVLNSAPAVQFEFSDPPPVTVGHSFAYTFPESAFVDSDGDLLSYQVQVPSFVNFDVNSRTVSGTPLANHRGDYTLQFTASDDYGGQVSATIYLSVNGLPVQQISFSSISTSQVGHYFSQMLPNGLFVDPDGDHLTYLLIEDIQHIKPAWLDFNPLTNTLSGTPTSNSHQAIPVRFKVSDGRGGEVFYDLSIHIPNSEPVVGQPLNDQSMSVDQTLGLTISNAVLRDPDGDPLFYVLERLSGGAQNWVSLTGNVITFSPKSGHQGAYQFRVTGSDPHGGGASTLLNVNVLNRPPRLVYEIPDPRVAHAGQVWSFSLDADNFADDDNDPFEYDAALASGAPLPQWITFNPIRRSFSGMPTGLDRGKTTLKVWVDDRFGGQAQGLFNVSVVNSEAVPRERLFDQQVSAIQGSFIFSIPEFIDPDGDQVRYSSRMRNGDPLPSWIDFDPVSRTYTVFPNQARPGNYLITVLSTDEFGTVNEENFNLAIQAAPSLDQGASTAEVLQLVLPLVAVVGLLTVVVSTLGWRTRRIAKTDRRVRVWAKVEQNRHPQPPDVVRYEELYLHLTAIAEQLNKDQSMAIIEHSLVEFSSLVARYYAQQGVKLTPFSRLLNLKTVNTLFKYVLSNMLELSEDHTLATDTVDAVRLLHFFLAIVLKHHTGRHLRLSYEVKAKYFKVLDALIERAPSKTRADIVILHELLSCREAVVCMTDTNTLGVLCFNSLSHILSPAGLVADLKALVFDIPSTWYVGLLTMNQRLIVAKEEITQLTGLQQYAANETNWEFRYGMITVLLNVITTTENKKILEQAIDGQQRYCRPYLLGYKHLLQANQSCLCRWRNHWVSRQAKWALNQVVDRLSQDAKRLLGVNHQLSPVRRIGKLRRVSVIVTPLDSQQLQAGAADCSRPPIQLTERKEGDLDIANPMYQGANSLEAIQCNRRTIHPSLVQPSGKLN